MSDLSKRIISVFLYTFPLQSSIPFGDNLFLQFPYLNLINLLTLPIELLESLLPFGKLLLFLTIFLGLVRNTNIPYFIRYNACQVILLNITLIISTYAINLTKFYELSILIFLISLIVIIYAVIQCILGVEPEIPFISQSARLQIY